MADKEDKSSNNIAGRFYVDSSCISCGMCCETAPACFKMDDESGLAVVYKQPNNEEEEASCEEAKDNCPVDAIGDDGE